MRLLPKIFAIITMLVSLSGCSMNNYIPQNPVADLPYRHNDFDYRFAWRTDQTDQGLSVEGLMKNVRYAQVESVTLSISLLNKENVVLASETTFPLPQTIKMDNYAPFKVTLKKVSPSKNDMLKFMITYYVFDGKDEIFQWHSSFTTDVSTGMGINDTVKNPDAW